MAATGHATVAADGHAASDPADLEEALRHYRVSAERGLLKILSKMGISLLASYHGAQLFEAVGLGSDLIELGFLGTPSRIGGLSVEELAQETVWIHQQAFPELSVEKLQDYGFVRYRPRGEYHLNNPEAAKTLRRACVEGLPDLYRSYSEKLAQRPPTVLRDLLRLVGDPAGAAAGEPRDDVEPVTAILPRFCTGGMSLGALSREAHETIAVAMARIHGRANSGEGGEDAVAGRHHRRRRPGRRLGAASRTCRGSRTATGPRRRSARSPRAASASPLLTWPGRSSWRSRSPRAPSRERAASCPATRSPRTSPGCVAPPPASRSSRRRRTTTSTRSRTWRELIYDLRMVNPRAGISVKLVAGTGIGTIAAGVAKAGADVIHVSGHGGGTAAASLNSIKHAGMPWELGLAEVHRALVAAGFREHVTPAR